jgi:hypothetical protein
MPNVRDDRDTPLCAGRDGEGLSGDLGPAGRRIFLMEALDRWNRIELVGEIKFCGNRRQRFLLRGLSYMK